MTSNTTNNNELQTRLTEYGNFITQTLQPQLQRAVNGREETEAEISEYRQLQTKLQQMLQHNNNSCSETTTTTTTATESSSDSNNNKRRDTSISTIVDISHSTIYCRTTIPNSNIVYINIGFGFHVEFTLSEGIEFINKRVQYLEAHVLKHRVEVAKNIAEDVENALELLESLGDELENSGEAKRGY